MTYTRFFAMIVTSTVVMFGLMYLNTYILAHVFFSETRAWMALVMGAVMAIIMLAFMLSMYANRTANIAIFAGAVLLAAVALWLVRSQITVGDVNYMRAMIPHHSIAIMTSERAGIRDPRVRKLANGIIAAQQKEISEMEYLIADIGDNGISTAAADEGGPAEVGTLQQALARPEISKLDPADVSADEATKVVGTGPGCTFIRTPRSRPILVTGSATDAGNGVMKLGGELIELIADGAGPTANSGGTFTAKGVSMSVQPVDGAKASTNGIDANLVFHLDQGLTVGYRGTWACAS